MKYKYKVNGLDCANCTQKLEDALNKKEEINDCVISFATGMMTFESNQEINDNELLYFMQSIEDEVTIDNLSTNKTHHHDECSCGHHHEHEHHHHHDHECECGHDHHHEHDHDHECCGHDHHHEHDHDHECCGHDHHEHDHEHGCCGHDQCRRYSSGRHHLPGGAESPGQLLHHPDGLHRVHAGLQGERGEIRRGLVEQPGTLRLQRPVHAGGYE